MYSTEEGPAIIGISGMKSDEVKGKRISRRAINSPEVQNRNWVKIALTRPTLSSVPRSGGICRHIPGTVNKT